MNGLDILCDQAAQSRKEAVEAVAECIADHLFGRELKAGKRYRFHEGEPTANKRSSCVHDSLLEPSAEDAHPEESASGKLAEAQTVQTVQTVQTAKIGKIDTIGTPCQPDSG